MKKHLYFLVSLAAVLTLLSSCRKEVLSPESIITVDAMELNDFDKWLEANFVNPYNIEFKYRYENNETDLNYYSVPADYDNSVIMAHLVKYLCIDSYDEVAGSLFTRKYFPKEFFLMGEWEYKNNGTEDEPVIEVVSITLSDGTKVDVKDQKTKYKVCITNYCAKVPGSVFEGKKPLKDEKDAPIDNQLIIKTLRNRRGNGEVHIPTDAKSRGSVAKDTADN